MLTLILEFIQTHDRVSENIIDIHYAPLMTEAIQFLDQFIPAVNGFQVYGENHPDKHIFPYKKIARPPDRF